MAAVGREAMSDEQSDGFLGRWSRRKVQARAGRAPADEAPPPEEAPHAEPELEVTGHDLIDDALAPQLIERGL